ncbi:MAG: hypothetical protein A3K19_27880 [Lentisphaerae bacterium RIFOXYB12_FULL_65_16]|nr:MAG: hypothetical protein A3K18_25885 [Lentisphaerae bacterium RIFOXYA12_64_32]OGV88184.1 MAG: hypothetical protein A3K19_27880 [Lentisphaerae bacterium RIFOXYB12_FULL_65_16]
MYEDPGAQTVVSRVGAAGHRCCATLYRSMAGALLALCCRSVLAQPVLTIELGPENRGPGLAVPSGGDGQNAPDTVNGVVCRRISGEKSLYMYVTIQAPEYAAGPKDLYVVAEVLDETCGAVQVQYDKSAPLRNVATQYSAAKGFALLVGGGDWRKLAFFLPEASLMHGQNFSADFRLCAPAGLAVRRIAVAATPPEGFDVGGSLDPESARRLHVERQAGMELTIGTGDVQGPMCAAFKAMSVTSIEQYVDWAGIEKEQDTWDWSHWDEQVATLDSAGLKWVPFLLVGPAYATPLWFHKSPMSRYYRCLEHGQESKVQSLFNPDLPKYVDRFLKAFAERYGRKGVIESVLLGITGIYGESIYPAGPEGGWTAHLTGDYHNHSGWWAGDKDAVAALRGAMAKRYADIAHLNQAWGTAYASFNDILPFHPDRAPSDRARADFCEWYMQAMTDWAVFWVKTTRRYFPHTEIYLCTGGSGTPVLGADFTAQAKAIAPYGAGIRITNEGSNYTSNFTFTREVATATRLYKTFCGFEPASSVDASGITARIFNATASGARQLHDYGDNPLRTGAALQNFRAGLPLLVSRRPALTAAVYLPRESWPFEPELIDRLYHTAGWLRDLTDLDFVTRCSVADGVLEEHRLLILGDTPVLEPESAGKIEEWVRQGGILVVVTGTSRPFAERLYDNRAWRSRLFAESAVRPGDLLEPVLNGPAPDRWVLQVGSAADEAWLFGDWNGRERGSEWPGLEGAAKRWSGGTCGVYLPVAPGADYTLKVSVHVPTPAARPAGNTVAVNGTVLGRMSEEGACELELPVPAAVLGQTTVARLEFDINTWVPALVDPKSGDKRKLGVAVRRIEWVRSGTAADGPDGTAMLDFRLRPEEIGACVKSVGKGYTLYLPGLADDDKAPARFLGQFIRDTGSALPGVAALAPEDGRLDCIYTTRTDGGVLRYDAKNGTIREEATGRKTPRILRWFRFGH